MQEILNIIHKTIYQFFDAYEDDAPMSDKDKLLLEVNKAICNNLKAVEKQPCESIKEIPKDYKYDTETEDFLVYRHMYTGHEIHIEKPAPRYKLEQQSCEDCISRQAALNALEALEQDAPSAKHASAIFECEDTIKRLPPVTPARKRGKWIPVYSYDAYGGDYETWMAHGNPVAFHYCSNCKEQAYLDEEGKELLTHYCPDCGCFIGE